MSQGPPQYPTPVYLSAEQWDQLMESVRVTRQSTYFIAVIVGMAAAAGLIVGFLALVGT